MRLTWATLGEATGVKWRTRVETDLGKIRWVDTTWRSGGFGASAWAVVRKVRANRAQQAVSGRRIGGTLLLVGNESSGVPCPERSLAFVLGSGVTLGRMDAPMKACAYCGRWFAKNPKLALHAQWPKVRFCSRRCQGQANKQLYMGRGLDLAQMRATLAQSFEDADVPYGECQCGCGSRTRIAKQSSSKDGHVNGEPVRFLKGHAGAAQPRNKHRGDQARQMVTAGVMDAGPGRWPPDAEVETIRNVRE